MSEPPTGRALILTFVLLVVLAGGSWIAADYLTSTALALVIAAVKAIAIGLVFMELGGAHTSDRLIVIIALGFVVLLCVGTLGDIAFR